MKKTIFGLFMIAVLMLSSIPAAAKANTNSFKNHWCNTDMEKLLANGVLSEDSIKNINLDGGITRAEFAGYIHKALDIRIYYLLAPNIEKTFTDVKNTDKCANTLNDLITTGILDDKGTFRPNDFIKREEAVYYMVRAYNYIQQKDVNDIKIQPSHSPAYRYVKDVQSIDKKYKTAVLKAYTIGLIKGRSNNLFEPSRNLTNAEAFALLRRINDIKVQKDGAAVKLTPQYTLTKSSFEMRAILTNRSKKNVEITFNTGQQYNFILLDKDNKEVYNFANGRMFTEALTKLVLKPGESKTFKNMISIIMSSVQYDKVMENAKYLKVQIPGTLSDGTRIKDEVIEIK